MLAPLPAVLAEVKPVVAYEDDDGGFFQAQLDERVEQQTDLNVDQRDSCMVCRNCLALLLVGVVGIFG